MAPSCFRIWRTLILATTPTWSTPITCSASCWTSRSTLKRTLSLKNRRPMPTVAHLRSTQFIRSKFSAARTCSMSRPPTVRSFSVCKVWIHALTIILGYITVFALQAQITKIGWFYFGQFTHPTSFYADDKYFYVSYAEPMNKSTTNMNIPPNSNPASPSPSPGATPEVQRRHINDPPVMANHFVKIYSVEGSINEFMTIK